MKSLILERAEVWLASQSCAVQSRFQIKVSLYFHSVLGKFPLTSDCRETAGPCFTCVLPLNINSGDRQPALLSLLLRVTGVSYFLYQKRKLVMPSPWDYCSLVAQSHPQKQYTFSHGTPKGLRENFQSCEAAYCLL